MSKAKNFLLSAAAAVAAMAFFLSCSEDLKPIERQTLGDYEGSHAQTSSSSGVVANLSSSGEGTDLSSSSEAENPSSSGGGEQKAAVSGVSQKGPFLNNSSVTLYELDNDLAPKSGRVFPGITDNKGSFEIKGIELASPYALLKADGFYRNEVTGGNSVAQITLYAIADMSNKSSANVNILTHLEYYRVQTLVQKGKNLAEAKKQALGEILAVFGIDGSGFKGSEEMSIFGTGDSDAALLAISILLQGDLSEGSFSALLADFSQKLKDSGTWDNKTMKSEMAEWASSADLAAIRGNIDRWGLSESVPDFEKYIRGYVEANSGTGGCIGLDSGNEFCHKGHAYPKCGDENGLGKYEYNPDTHFCSANNYTVAKCGGKVVYEPPGERCNYGVIEKQCGANWYDPSQYYCYNGSDLRSCGNPPLPYNPVTQFCELATIYDKCGGTVEYTPGTEQCCGSEKYTVATQFCSGSTIYSKCGSNDYNPSTNFCLGSTVTPLCGGQTFASSHFCLGSTVTPLCGGQTFASSQFCHGSTIYSKCDGSDYNPGTHFCLGSAATPLCGGKTYASSQFCSGNAVYDKCGGTVEFAPGTEQCCGSGKYTIATQFCYSSSKVGQKCGSRTETYDPDLYQCKSQINPNGIYLKTPVSYEGESYEAVLIGTQTWMAKNLNYNASGSVCYENNSANCSTYGRLYNWSTAMSLPSNCDLDYCSSQIQAVHRGVCPSGWHIPTDAEWDALVTFAGGSSTAGTKLKAASVWNNSNKNGTDNYGFSALPGGHGVLDGSFNFAGNYGYWWSATEGGWYNGAYYRYMLYNLSDVSRQPYNKNMLLSVRCLRD